MDKTPDSLGKIEQLLDEIADTEAEDIKAWEREYQKKQAKLDDDITEPIGDICQLIYDLSLDNEILDLDTYVLLSNLASVVIPVYLLEGCIIHLVAAKRKGELSKELYDYKIDQIDNFIMSEFRQEIMEKFRAVVRNYLYEENLQNYAKNLDSASPSISPEKKS